jgi:hypothetical protein
MCRRLSTLLVVLVLLLALPAAAAAMPDRSDEGVRPTMLVEMRPTTGEKAVAIALRYLGTPYSWAGASPAGFDCSGFVMYVYGKLDITLPHSSWMLWSEGRRHRLLQRPLPRRHLRPEREVRALATFRRRREDLALLRGLVRLDVRRRPPRRRLVVERRVEESEPA